MSLNITEGEDYYVWLFNHAVNKECLAIATLNLCDHCERPATTNSVWAIKFTRGEEIAKSQADAIKEEYGELTELGADDEGDCYCEKCYSKHAVIDR